jgi:hypothetical protein
VGVYEPVFFFFHRVKMEINRSFVNEVVQYIKRVRETERQAERESETGRESERQEGSVLTHDLVVSDSMSVVVLLLMDEWPLCDSV